jgi:hypothetical protein
MYFVYCVLIRNSIPNIRTNSIIGENTADYSLNLQNNSMIFASLDSADISVLRNVKRLYIFIKKLP